MGQGPEEIDMEALAASVAKAGRVIHEGLAKGLMAWTLSLKFGEIATHIRHDLQGQGAERAMEALGQLADTAELKAYGRALRVAGELVEVELDRRRSADLADAAGLAPEPGAPCLHESWEANGVGQPVRCEDCGADLTHWRLHLYHSSTASVASSPCEALAVDAGVCRLERVACGLQADHPIHWLGGARRG